MWKLFQDIFAIAWEGCHIMNRQIRIKSITIDNFKNVKHGKLDFMTNKDIYSADVIGIYGQNGSGKTAVVDSLKLLQHMLRGNRLGKDYLGYINVDSDAMHLTYIIQIVADHENSFVVNYSFSIKKELVDVSNNVNTEKLINEPIYRVRIFDEELAFSETTGSSRHKQEKLVSTRATDTVLPKVKYKALVGNDDKTDEDIRLIRKQTANESRTFIFSAEFLNIVRKNCKNIRYRSILEFLVHYGNFELFTIGTQSSGLISLNALPLAFDYKDEQEKLTGQYMVPINDSADISKKEFKMVKKLVKPINLVLKKLIPELTIEVNDLGPVLLGNTSIKGERIQLMSCKNSHQIPLKYESEGIKKIISILQLLIAVYNKSSITVAVDELDSGIFEYLLGQMLSVISEKGKGQLIFTSHNLRPLEVLKPDKIIFTNVNPNDRYCRINHIKKTNNLRACYYRKIALGYGNDALYDETTSFDLALAFKKAGEYIED